MSSCKEPIFWWNAILLVRRSSSEMGNSIYFELNMFVSHFSKIQIASSLWSKPNSNYSLQQLFMMYRTSTEESLIWPYSLWKNWMVLRLPFLQSLFVLCPGNKVSETSSKTSWSPCNFFSTWVIIVFLPHVFVPCWIYLQYTSLFPCSIFSSQSTLKFMTLGALDKMLIGI